MSALLGNWFTVGGRPVFLPPGMTLSDVQASCPRVLATTGISAEAQEFLEWQRQHPRSSAEDIEEVMRLLPR